MVLGRLDFGESWVDRALGWGLEAGCLVFGIGLGGFGCEVGGTWFLRGGLLDGQRN